ncbi:MAG: HlyD family efflux transporter periplasmic adaptor subunit, partial [Gemmatimonadetes bacterium]|nr:HlyD family efflux transporter periplasmic adaptor subunit [Gemmatimonadota bacterium]
MDIPRDPPPKRKRYVLIGVGAIALVGVTVALGSLKPAAPTVESPWIDKVKRGPMVRQVRGPGTLVPEQIRWISAVTQGRVERVLVQPGETVQPGTVLLELSNPDELLQALDAERALTTAQAQLIQIKTNLESQQLAQRAAVAAARSAYQEARRQLDVAMQLAKDSMVSPQELELRKDNELEAKTRLDVAERQLALMTDAIASQVASQEAQVEGTRRLVEMRRARIASMQVRAGTEGVVQDLTLQPGQWVMSGTTLAKVVQPSRLKAVLRVPETQAKDVSLGLKAEIDTRNGIVQGKVTRIDPASQGGTVGVDVSLEGDLPAGARPDLSVDGTIEIERLTDVLSVGRPAFGQSESTVSLFKLEPGGKHATRVTVKLGRTSVNTVEIVEGLREGDEV